MATNGAAATAPAPKDVEAGLRPESSPFAGGKELEERDPTYKTDFGFLVIPRRLRHDPARPFEWTLLLNISFGFASTFSESQRSCPFLAMTLTSVHQRWRIFTTVNLF